MIGINFAEALSRKISGCAHGRHHIECASIPCLGPTLLSEAGRLVFGRVPCGARGGCSGAVNLKVGSGPNHQIPDARASGFIFPIPAKSGFPISRIRDSGQIGIPDFPNPGFRPNRDSRFPEIRDSGQIGIQIRENPDFFCSGQNRDCTLSAAGQAIAFPRRGPWVGKEAHRPMNRSRQRLHGPVEAHTT